MRSKAQIKSHPLHPILIAFPIAFLIGALVGDIAAYAAGWGAPATVGAYLSIAGIIAGLVAAVPGLIDYFGVIPPDSSGKRRATWHLAVNVSALTLFAVGAAGRDWDTLRPGLLTVVFELASVGLMSVGGYLGGTLVYRNQIGVDHRYAGAGKWHEETVAGQPGEPVEVPGANDLKAGQMMLVHVGDRRVVLARTDDGFAAFDDHCTHRGGPLCDGVLVGGVVQCPWHGSQFDVRDGHVAAGPAKEAIATHEASEVNGKVCVMIKK
jgi:nitrite reductase/ring-hydroxylating ferredoxin subunit/uncharacterized membrane protein